MVAPRDGNNREEVHKASQSMFIWLFVGRQSVCLPERKGWVCSFSCFSPSDNQKQLYSLVPVTLRQRSTPDCRLRVVVIDFVRERRF